MMATTFASWDPNSGMSQADFLYQQIAAQKLAGLGSWTGNYDADASMRLMASDLEASGITNLGQLGWSDRAERPYWKDIPTGGTFGAEVPWSVSESNDQAQPFAGYAEDDPNLGRWTSGIINKDTGDLLRSGYAERTQGNTWSGTYQGKGNTGFDLNFDAEGNPIFGTHGASSVSSSDWMPLGALLAGGAMFAAPFVAGAMGVGGAGAASTGAVESLAGLGTGAAEAGAYTGAGSLGWTGIGANGAGLTSAAELGAGSGAFLGEGVASGVGAWDTAAGMTGAGSATTGAAGLAGNTPQQAFRLSEIAAQGAGAGTATSGLSFDSLIKNLGLANPDGSLNTPAALKALLSTGSGIYGMSLAADQRKMLEQAILASAPWTTSGGTAMAGEELKRVISGDLSNDPGFKLAQQAAARATSQQPGGMASSAAAMAALKYQNDRIAALSGPAGTGFAPGTGYQTAASGMANANDLTSSSLASLGFGTTSSQMPPWVQQYLIKNGMGA